MEITNLDQNERISELEAFKEDIFNTIYPIGSLYLTFNKDFNPNDTFTGTWTRNGAKGYTLVGAIDPDDYRDPSNSILEIAGGSTKGEVNHTLTIEEMPSHTHNIYYPQDYADVQHDTVKYEGFLNNLQAPQAISPTGGDQPHNNVQPSIGVYIWHRTA